MSDDRPMSRRGVIAALGAASLTVAVPRTAISGHRLLAPPPDVERLLRLARVPSLSMATVDRNGVTTLAFGMRRSDAPDRATTDTIYAAASLTKVVFAWMLLGLVHDGVLSLDRPVREYLPHPNDADTRAAALTIRHLLSHSGGWPNWRSGATQPLVADFVPGSRFSYSGEGFFHLQRLVEVVTGQSMGILIRDRVLRPLGMQQTSVLAVPDAVGAVAPGHNSRGEPLAAFPRAMVPELQRMMKSRGLPLEAATVVDAEQALKTAEPSRAVIPNWLAPNAASSLVTTAGDYGKFVHHLVTARRRGGASAAIAALLLTPQVRLNESLQWGLGIGLETQAAGRQLAWQWGDNPGFKNFVLLDPDQERAVVVFTNGDRGARVYERVVTDWLGDDLSALLWI